MKIMVINGPIQYMLKRPEAEICGNTAIESLNERLARQAGELGISCEFFQSNSEGALVTAIQNSMGLDGVILNAGDYAHYSIAIRDAIASIKAKTPVIELHLINVYASEDFRHISMLSPVCVGVISGFGPDGYFLALSALHYEYHAKTAKRPSAK